MTTIEHTAPAWATEHEADGTVVRYFRRATAQPTVIDSGGNSTPAEVALYRVDSLVVDENGAVSVEVGPVRLFVGDLEQLDVDQARVLAAAITELLYVVPDEPQDGTFTV